MLQAIRDYKPIFAIALRIAAPVLAMIQDAVLANLFILNAIAAKNPAKPKLPAKLSYSPVLTKFGDFGSIDRQKSIALVPSFLPFAEDAVKSEFYRWRCPPELDRIKPNF